MLQAWQRTIDARLWGDGASVAYERSLEGRVANMENALKSADALADAARELRRVRDRRLTGVERTFLVAVGVVTAVGSVVAAVAALLQ